MSKHTVTGTLHIAHCIHGLGLGGAQQIVKTLVGSLGPDYRSLVYCCLDGPVRAEIESSGTVVRILERRLSKFDPAWVFKLARAMRRDEIGLVHTHLFGDSLHASLAAQAAGNLPVLMTLHSRRELLKPMQRLGYRWLLSRSTRAVACSEAVRRSFLARSGPNEGRLLTIRNGIEDPMGGSSPPPDRTPLRLKLGLDPDAVVLATIGRLSKEKGLSALISAYAPLARSLSKKSQLLIFGDGPLRQELQRQVRIEGLGESVLLLGFQSRIPEILPAIDVVVFNSLSEGLPVALLEAMASSRCIVGTAIPGMLEAVRPDKEGLLVPVGSRKRLRDALARAIGTPALRKQLGRAARARYVEVFRADRMVRSYESLYREIARQEA